MTQRLYEQVNYSELKEANTHLEEELRAELEEKQHVINTLNSKVALLKNQEPASLGYIEHRLSWHSPSTQNLDTNSGRQSWAKLLKLVHH